MSETKFTPGPWRQYYGRDIMPEYPTRGYSTGFAPLCRIVGDKRTTTAEINAANAHLIAAAPELYEALKWLVSDVKDYEAWQRPCAAVDAALVVLAKARGEGV